MKIEWFRGKNFFLSNFYPSPIYVSKNLVVAQCATVENAYQASKATDIEEFLAIAYVKTPAEAKRLGKRVKLPPFWDDIKVAIMKQLVNSKFMDYRLQQMLKATGDAELIEGNWWGDKFWGVCDGEGENMLGKILMEIRSQL